MSKKYESLEHTADAGLAATADTRAELYEALAEGLADMICKREHVRPRHVRHIKAEADDEQDLAVDFLWDVMSLIQYDGFCVASVQVTGLTRQSVEAELFGEAFDPDRHEFSTEVKAVTYHSLKIGREGRVWKARVYFDL